MKNRSISLEMKLATLFGIGRAPIMPGTMSCLAALLVFILVQDRICYAVIALAVTVMAFLVSGPAEIALGKKDHKFIVIDDFAGMLLTYLLIPFDYRFLLVGFFLFRMLDMLKAYPANLIEKKSGALGVVGDDVMAAVYANIILHIVVASGLLR